MIKFIDVSGKTEDEAIAKALEQLGMDRDDVSVEILAHAKSGFLGFGGTPASVRVSYDDGEPEPKAEVKPEPQSDKQSAFRPEQRKSKEERAREEAEAKAEQERKQAEARKNAPKPEMPASFQPEVLQKDKKAAEKAEREQKREQKRAAAKAELGEEVHDEKSEQIRRFISGLLAHMESAAEVKVYEVEKGRYKAVLEGEKLGALIGRRGETLDAIQQLTGYAVNHGSDKGRVRVQVDAENYREKREQSLERLAEKVAAKVVKYRRNVTLEPMNAYERHVIHTALQETAHVTTFSIGTEPNRRVVVSYDRTKQ